jgi:hypothetical protein
MYLLGSEHGNSLVASLRHLPCSTSGYFHNVLTVVEKVVLAGLLMLQPL